MNTLEDYDIPLVDMEATMLGWATEALELRHGEAGDPEGDLAITYGEVIEPASYLIRVRVRSDRVDELLSRVVRAKGRIERAKEAARFQAELAYDQATDSNARTRTREFVTGKERHAEASLQSLEQRMTAHRAERLLQVAKEAYDIIQGVHWQLERIRNDTRATIKNLQFESSLER